MPHAIRPLTPDDANVLVTLVREEAAFDGERPEGITDGGDAGVG